MNLKIMEHKIKLPIEYLLSVLAYNNEPLQQVIKIDWTGSDRNPLFDSIATHP